MSDSMKNFVTATLAKNKSDAVSYEALELWRELFKAGDIPYGDSYYCFACKRSKMSYHAEDCIYMRAKRIVVLVNANKLLDGER